MGKKARSSTYECVSEKWGSEFSHSMSSPGQTSENPQEVEKYKVKEAGL
jgi:hypothetical protein